MQPSRTARNHLLWLAHSQGLGAWRVDEVVEQVGLGTVARRRAGGFSLGMRQRLGIAAALLGDPPVLMLDEPVNGLDPEGIVWIRNLLRSLAAEGRAVLVSSHLMSEMQDMADHLVVVGRGRVVADTSVADLIAAASDGRVTLRTTARPEAMEALARAGARVAVQDRDTLTVSGLEAGRIVALLGANDVPFSEVAAHRASLEEAYMELTRDAVEFRATTPETGRRPHDGPHDGHDRPRDERARRLTAPGARRMDQVQDRTRLGGRHDPRRGARRGAGAAVRGGQPRLLRHGRRRDRLHAHDRAGR
ncbi:hypothetical protein GCM10027612_36320 [Microbispora bryophytorum subsp. camponoti]